MAVVAVTEKTDFALRNKKPVLPTNRRSFCSDISFALADPAVRFHLGDLYQKCAETPELRVTYLRLANHTQVEAWPLGDAPCIAVSISANSKA